MTRRVSLLLVVALLGCDPSSSPSTPGAPDDDPVEEPEPGSAYVPSAGHEHLEPPPPHGKDPQDEGWTEAPVEDTEGPVLERQVLVQVVEGVDLAALALRHGTLAIESPDARGFGSVAVPQDEDPQALLADLMADPDLLHAGRMGLVVGAADGWAVPYQWHHESMQRLAAHDMPPDVGDVVVAILDTGIAYEDHEDADGRRYRAASTLAATRFVAPWDFVNDDAHPNDDHQHGTHLASLIASEGEVAGAAPGVALMPVKVLDANKRGTELDLVRGIDHAVHNGADVINLSLSFPSGYVPSLMVRSALQEAHEAGVVLVGAAGNEGVRGVTWPAASPHVIAVGAVDAGDELAPYSNWGGALDLLAPGGDLAADLDLDGLPDGILGQTLALGDPEDIGLWLIDGTSQATALVSAVAALRLAATGDPASVVTTLQKKTASHGLPEEGLGAGLLRADATVLAGDFRAPPLHYATLRPFLADWGGGQLQPGVRVRVLDARGAPVSGMTAFGTFVGSSGASWSCVTGSDGGCVDQVDPVVGDPKADALAWVVTLDGTSDTQDRIVRPRRALVASDALDVLSAAMHADSDAREAILLFVDEPGIDKILGLPIARAYVSMDLGAGLVETPVGLLATPAALDPWIARQVVRLDVDGTGLMSSPVGAQTLVLAGLLAPTDKDLAVDGTGLLSSPMLGFRPRMAVLGSSGPLGFDVSALTEPDSAPVVDVVDPKYAGELVLLDEGTVIDSKVVDSSLQDQLDAGAWEQGGVGGASAVAGNGQVSTAVEGSAATHAAVEVVE